jgi:hypothetical protein
VNNEELVQTLVQIAKEVEIGDPFDWADVPISEEEAYRLMAMHVLELSDDRLALAGIITKLLVENMVLNVRLLQCVKS